MSVDSMTSWRDADEGASPTCMHAWVHRHVTEAHDMEALGRRTTSAPFLTCRLARRSLATRASPRPVFVLVWC